MTHLRQYFWHTRGPLRMMASKTGYSSFWYTGRVYTNPAFRLELFDLDRQTSSSSRFRCKCQRGIQQAGLLANCQEWRRAAWFVCLVFELWPCIGMKRAAWKTQFWRAFFCLKEASIFTFYLIFLTDFLFYSITNTNITSFRCYSFRFKVNIITTYFIKLRQKINKNLFDLETMILI